MGLLRRFAGAAEESLAALALAAMVFLLLVESFVRPWMGFAIPGSLLYVRQLTLWVALLGGALAASQGRLLALSTNAFVRDRRTQHATAAAGGAAGAGVAAILFVAAISLVHGEYQYAALVAGALPVWVSQLVLPIGFGLIALRIVGRVPSPVGRTFAALGLVAGIGIALRPEPLAGTSPWPFVGIMIAAGALGAPLFAVLGGLAVFLFMADGTSATTVLVHAYELTTNPTLPALPVFTLAGFLLAEGDTAARLLRLFRALFGWLRGGTAIVCAMVCAFFTVFTGGSGVTILALGGLLLPALLRDGYPDRFSVGLLTSSGSLGLLLPPALPLILYGIVSETPIQQLFIGGILPGLVMIALVAAYGMWQGGAGGVPRARFDSREALAALWHARWEFLLPIVVLGAFFTGFATILETSALTAVYAFAVQVFIHRNIRSVGQVRRVLADSVMTIGGVLIILAAAVGFTAYLVDADVPGQLVALTRHHIDSPLVFLLALNVFLLIVGCLMDIFSAILVVVPLIAPLGAEFGIHPVHLGIIFIANLELGYITPPVGLNLFLASYRFDRPVIEIYRASIAFLLILGIGVLLITYVPWLTMALLPLAGGGGSGP